MIYDVYVNKTINSAFTSNPRWNWIPKKFIDCTFEGNIDKQDFRHCIFTNCTFTNAVFNYCDFRGSNYNPSTMDGTANNCTFGTLEIPASDAPEETPCIDV